MPSVLPAPDLLEWTLPGGLRVAYERRAGPGFALDLRLPVGSAHDPAGEEGTAALLDEWLLRGAGGRDARALQEAFDDLGVRRGGGVGPESTRLSVSGLSADLDPAMNLLADVLMRPTLDEAAFPVLLDLARQDLAALEDSPADLLALRARELAFPRPEGSPLAGYAHSPSGTPAGLRALRPERVRGALNRLGQAGSVLGLVADLPPEQARERTVAAFGGLRPGLHQTVPAQFHAAARAHVRQPGAEQTHLSLTLPGVAPRHPDWLPWQLAVAALSGGSSSRLFHAVREERGLAYSVGASAVVLGGEGFLAVYAGTTPGRAAETLRVVRGELERWSLGLSAEEFIRARRALESGVVFGAESLRGRASALTRDVALFGRARPLAEVRAALSALTLEGVNAFLARSPAAAEATVVTLGPEREGPHV